MGRIIKVILKEQAQKHKLDKAKAMEILRNILAALRVRQSN